MQRQYVRSSLIVLGLVLPLQGCSCTHNRQSIYPNRQSAGVQVGARNSVSIRAPFVAVDVPTKDIPTEQTKLDVPMLKQ